jgi:8-oxo-dGTP pyrophosphatase MutT (NUDIX family)
MANWARQAAVIPVRDGRVCMVTSSSGRRWVVPKGQIDPGHTAGEAALVEAWEEAGLVGALAGEPVGTYAYEKYGRELLVLVFRMLVTEARDDWPERSIRAREWVTLDEALERIDEPGLRDLMRIAFRLDRPAPLSLATA